MHTLLPQALLLLSPALCGQDSQAELIANGRRLLAERKPAEAQVLFEQADELSGRAFATHLWLLRAWMEQGRINDALNALDGRDRADRESPGGDYVYGMASYLRAKDYLTKGVETITVSFAFQDATTFLASATQAAPEIFTDAWLPLAEASWYSQDLDLAEAACAKAIELDPKNGQAHYVLGRVYFSQFSVASGDEAQKDAAQALLDNAIATFRAAAAILAEPADHEKQLAAKVHNQLGNAMLWKESPEEAAKEFSAAMGWDPSVVDFGMLWARYATEKSAMPMVNILEAGAKKYVQHYGDETPGDALLLWWLGYSNFTEREDARAAEVYAQAVAKWPAYVDSWYYIATAKYRQKDYVGAYAALREHWAVDPANLVAQINSNRDTNLANLSGLIDWCAKEGRILDAALLCEMRVGAETEHWLYWDNLGLFSRDAGERLDKSRDEADREHARKLFERSYDAYGRARELAPDKPHLLNDGAVLLHYYLDRDYETARQMYREALAQATELLASGTLEGFELELAKTAKRDSADNLRKLERIIEKQGGGH